MKPDFGFHVPGVKGLFEYDEIVRRTNLPRKLPDGSPNPRYMKVPKMVRVETRSAKGSAQRLGEFPWPVAKNKFG